MKCVRKQPGKLQPAGKVDQSRIAKVKVWHSRQQKQSRGCRNSRFTARTMVSITPDINAHKIQNRTNLLAFQDTCLEGRREGVPAEESQSLRSWVGRCEVALQLQKPRKQTSWGNMILTMVRLERSLTGILLKLTTSLK